jgi:hypothetical protein
MPSGRTRASEKWRTGGALAAIFAGTGAFSADADHDDAGDNANCGADPPGSGLFVKDERGDGALSQSHFWACPKAVRFELRQPLQT